MLDARNIYRKVTRKIYDFSPEQMQNLAAIVWLYRGQRDRFLELVKQYFASSAPKAGRLHRGSKPSRQRSPSCANDSTLSTDAKDRQLKRRREEKGFRERRGGTRRCERLYESDRDTTLGESRQVPRSLREETAGEQRRPARCAKAFDPIAEAINGLIKQVDLLYKLAARIVDLAARIAFAD